MRIAFIYDAVYPWTKGGVEKRVYEISRRLARKGHEVHLFGMKLWDETDIVEQNGVLLHGVCKPIELYVSGRRSIKEALYFACCVLPHLVEQKFDITDCQEFPYFPCFSVKLYSMICRLPFVITWHEVWADYWYEYLGAKGVFGSFVERITMKLTSNNIAVSERTKRNLEVAVKDVTVIPNGIDFEKIRKVKRSNEDSDVIFVGRLTREKNVDFLIRAIDLAKQTRYIRCLVIGDGPERDRLEKLVIDLGLEENVDFLGFLENDYDVYSYMKASKVFVLPSTREGFGIVALEANACGLPVVTVTHERNAASDIVEPGKNGFLCRLSEKEIADEIIASLNNTMSEKCVENARTYDWDGIAENYERYLQEIA